MPRKNIGMHASGAKKEPKKGMNENAHHVDMKAVRVLDKGKVPLRVNSNTIILVKPENRNSEYGQDYLSRVENSRINY